MTHIKGKLILTLYSNNMLFFLKATIYIVAFFLLYKILVFNALKNKLKIY